MSNKLFRRDPWDLTAQEKELVDRIHKIAEDLYESIDMAPPSVSREHAVRKLQECVMWAVKAVGTHR